MTRLLYVKGNPKDVERSYSLRLGQRYVDAYLIAHRDVQVTELDLYRDDVPLIDVDVMSAWGKLAAGEALSPTEAHKVGRLGELVDQFLASDVVVMAVPMWNFGYPPMVKAYMDAVTVAGKTFAFTPEGSVGLATGKKVVVLEARGNIYQNTPLGSFEHSSSHLRCLLNFMGITDISVVVVEGVALDPGRGEEILHGAVVDAEALAHDVIAHPA